MKIEFWSIGKPNESHVKEGIEMFTKRISNYYPVSWNILQLPKNTASLSEAALKKKEGELILNLLEKRRLFNCPG